MPTTNQWLMLILFLAVCLGVGGSGLDTHGEERSRLVSRLRKPPGTPPSWVFGPVWTTLYVLMAVSAWLVWRQYGWGARAALLIFLAQLALNLAWSGIFFGARLGPRFGGDRHPLACDSVQHCHLLSPGLDRCVSARSISAVGHVCDVFEFRDLAAESTRGEKTSRPD